MLTTRLFLDKRKPDKQGLYTLYMVVSKDGRSAMTSLGIKLATDQWNNGEVVEHPDKKFLNTLISAKKGEFDKAILELGYSGVFAGKNAAECMALLLDSINPERAIESKLQQPRDLFMPYYRKFSASKVKSTTKDIYEGTEKVLNLFFDSNNIDASELRFDDITKTWLSAFEGFCLHKRSRNTVSIHLRNIRAAFNAAIDDGITTNYPFRRFHIRTEVSKDKSYTASELRSLFFYKSEVAGEREAIEIYKLMFLLIGINSIDLVNLGKPVKGRVEYIRAKTGKLYSVKIEPEAYEVIRKFEGQTHLLDCIERVPNYKTYFHRLVKSIHKVGTVQRPGMKSDGAPLFPDISSGAMRTSWATIAQEELDIPREVIAAALGHHTVDVTTTYLRTDWRKKVDAANRRVIDWVLYDKK